MHPEPQMLEYNNFQLLPRWVRIKSTLCRWKAPFIFSSKLLCFLLLQHRTGTKLYPFSSTKPYIQDTRSSLRVHCKDAWVPAPESVLIWSEVGNQQLRGSMNTCIHSAVHSAIQLLMASSKGETKIKMRLQALFLLFSPQSLFTYTLALFRNSALCPPSLLTP